jgi:selenocysteine lyase/cysteine desulfurase
MPAALSVDSLIAREFPRVLGAAPYLNSASTGPLPERGVAAQHAVNELRAEPWKFPADHQFATLTRARQLIARLIGAAETEIALMVNTTYGVNLAARALPLEPGDVIVISDRDFPANVYPWLALERTRGVTVRRLPCRGRLFDEEAMLAALDDPRVKILAVSWVSSETGIRLDLHKLGSACRARGIFFVVDAIQGLGAATLDVGTTPIDILSCGAQKWLLSPWGTGFVYVRPGLVRALEPQAVGWMSVQDSDDFTKTCSYNLRYREDARRFEVITLPFQDFAGMNGALEVLHEAGPGAVAGSIREKTQRIVDWAHGQRSIELVTPGDPERRAGIVLVIPADPVGASRRLAALNIGHSLRDGAIRLSPHFFTPDEHIDRVLRELERS